MLSSFSYTSCIFICSQFTVFTLHIQTDRPEQIVQSQIRCCRIWSGSPMSATHSFFLNTSAGRKMDLFKILTLIMLNKLRCYAHFYFSANQITWFRLLIQIHILHDKQCRSRSVGFCGSQLIWIYTVCKGWEYPGLARLGLKTRMVKSLGVRIVMVNTAI